MSKALAVPASKTLRNGMILLIVVLAFVATYQIAAAAGSDAVGGNATGGGLIPAANTAASDASAPSCACCGNSGTGEPVEGAAVVEGDVQRISVDASNGYNPNVIKLTSGVPAEITFSQASGCMAEVVSEDLGFYEDLTGGPVTVRIEADALQPGEYSFSCGMQMAFGTVIVQ